MEELKDAGRQAAGRQADGRRLLHSRDRRAQHARRRPLAPTGPRTASSSSTRTTRPTSSAPGTRRTSSTRRIGAVTEQPPFDQVMDFSVIEKLGSEPKYASQKNEYDVRFAPASRQRDPGRVGRDPHQDGRHPLLPQLLGPEQEGHARRSTARTSRSCTIPNVDVRARGGRQAGRPVRRGAHRDRRPHRRLDEGAGADERGAGAVAQPRQRREGGARQEVPDAAAEPVHAPRAWAGTAPRTRPIPSNHAKNRRVEIKVYPAEAGGAAPKSDGRRPETRLCSRSASRRRG